MAITPDAWTVIGTGAAILIAIAASNRQIRTDPSQMRAEFGQLRKHMAKLEGLMGLREAIAGRKVACFVDVVRWAMVPWCRRH